MKNKKIMRVFAFCFALLFILTCFPLSAFAETYETNEDIMTSDVMEDLKKLEGYTDREFTTDETAEYCDIIELIEFGFSYYGSEADYGLYLYIYNPSCKEIDINSNLSYKNKVQLRVAPPDESNVTSTNISSQWRKFTLQHLDNSADYMFYKFKIELPSGYTKGIDKTLRRYEISDVEFIYKGEDTQRSVGSGGWWAYTGYQEYHGIDTNATYSTLYWNSENLLTLELNINPASWKTKTSDKGVGWQYELSSVYFSVPNSVIREYGDPDDVYKGLREVSCYYYQVSTDGVFIKDGSLYDIFLKYINEDNVDDAVPISFYTWYHLPGDFWGDGSDYTVSYMYTDNYYWDRRDGHLLSADNILTKYRTAFNLDIASGVTQSEFLDAINVLREDYGGLPCLSYVKDPYHVITTEDGDLANEMASYASKHGENFIFEWLTGNPLYVDQGYDGIEPITIVDKDYITKNKDEACGEEYFICEEDAGDFCDYVKSAKTSETVYLMRFAVSDYYCEDIKCNVDGEKYGFDEGNYYFRKDMFLDFDILSLTWENANGVRKVLPVTATPVDIVGTPTPPVEPDGGIFGDIGRGVEDVFNWAKWLFDLLASLRPVFIILLVLAVLAVLSYFPGLAKLLGGIIALPFKAVGWLAKNVFAPDHAKKTDYKYKKKLEEDKQKNKEGEK